MNKKRHTASILPTCKYFGLMQDIIFYHAVVLNVPTKEQETLALQIGGCSGSNTDKFKEFSIPICQPGIQLAVLDS